MNRKSEPCRGKQQGSAAQKTASTSRLETTLFLIVPVLSLNIADGIMRFSLDETYDKREVFMVGVRRYIAACVLCILLVGVNQCFSIIKTLTLYPQLLVLYFVTSLMSDVLNNYARGIEKVS